MGFWGWVILFFAVCIAIAVLQAIAQGSQHNEQGNALVALPEFTPAVVHKGLGGGAGIAIDVDRKKFAISKGAHDTKVFEFSQLIAVEVLRNGASIQKSNRGSQVAGAAVGAVLLGPVGLLLGGLTGSKRSEEKINKLSLKVFTNDIIQPVHEIVFHDLAGSKPDSLVVKHASQELDAWHGRLQTILVMSERAA